MPRNDALSCDGAELARLVRAGDDAALERLTRCFGDKLAAVGARACKDRERGRDAAQDALLAAGTKLDAYRGDGSVEGWLTSMVVNACRRMARGRKNDPRLHVAGAEVAAPGDAADAVAERREVAARLQEALLGLEPTDRAVLLLAEAEEWSSDEIAAELDMTAGAVRTRLSRVRARLRQLLGPAFAPNA